MRSHRLQAAFFARIAIYVGLLYCGCMGFWKTNEISNAKTPTSLWESGTEAHYIANWDSPSIQDRSSSRTLSTELSCGKDPNFSRAALRWPSLGRAQSSFERLWRIAVHAAAREFQIKFGIETLQCLVVEDTKPWNLHPESAAPPPPPVGGLNRVYLEADTRVLL